jgi:RES domain-containing protein
MPMRRRQPDEAGQDEMAEIAALADGSLAPERRAALDARIAGSPELAGLLAEQQRAIALTSTAAIEVEAPTALRARIQQRGARRRPARWNLIAAGSAVAVVTAVVVALAVHSTGTSGEQFRTALTPTGLVPGAGGEATLTKTSSGWRIELDATGLPRRQGRLFYEAWLRNRAGVLVPIGTFNQSRKVTLWAGVSPKDYPSLTVTREQADGNQASSGEKVLVGTARPGGQ